MFVQNGRVVPHLGRGLGVQSAVAIPCAEAEQQHGDKNRRQEHGTKLADLEQCHCSLRAARIRGVSRAARPMTQPLLDGMMTESWAKITRQLVRMKNQRWPLSAQRRRPGNGAAG